MVLLARIELAMALYQSASIPFTYRSGIMAGDEGIEPPNPESKSDVIPFN
jgi:hypothetical protein